MGQKVHPLGLRVGITKKHQSQWFARFHKNKYAQSVLEDRMLRQTLTQLFPQLLNPVFKKQRDNESSIAPKITQIKIERGLIPYEIGIQIHAENCDLIKSSIENLKINSDFVSRLQKTRRYFQHLRFKLNDSLDQPGDKINYLEGNVNNEEKKIGNVESTVDTSRLKGDRFGKNEGPNTSFRKKGSKFGRLTKSQLRRQRLILKRLKKRQLIRRRYKQLAREARFFLTKNGNKVIQKLTLNKGNNVSNTQKGNRNKGMQKNFNKRVPSNKTVTKVSSKSRVSKTNFGQKPFNIFQSRIKKKFVSIYRNKMNKKFLQVLKSSILALNIK